MSYIVTLIVVIENIHLFNLVNFPLLKGEKMLIIKLLIIVTIITFSLLPFFF